MLKILGFIFLISLQFKNCIHSYGYILDGDIGTVSPDPKAPDIVSGKTQEQYSRKRKSYGGKQDKLHLGGFTSKDISGISENTWNWMMGSLGVRSLIDLGCGRGISTSYFLKKGAQVLCVEGSHDAIQQSLLPRELIVQHDFTRGPWWPNATFDAVWSVEFLEHVGRHYIKNYLPVLRRAALIFVTYSRTGGWHHVEVRDEWWWRVRFQAQGFVYSLELSQAARRFALAGSRYTNAENRMATNPWGAEHIVDRMMVFINPKVASMPEYDHLMSGHGCIWGDNRGLPCGPKYKWWTPVDSVPDRYQPLINCTLDKLEMWLCD